MIDLLQKRLATYEVINAIEEENALKEILQEIILFALWQVEFFEVAAFQGGTSLRILHQLPRFSEDLDFILKEPGLTFSWQPFLEKIKSTSEVFGVEAEVLGRAQMDRPVKTAIIKDNSIANQLNSNFTRDHLKKKLRIKLEIDSNLPVGSGFDYTYLDFPVDFEVSLSIP